MTSTATGVSVGVVRECTELPHPGFNERTAKTVRNYDHRISFCSIVTEKGLLSSNFHHLTLGLILCQFLTCYCPVEENEA